MFYSNFCKIFLNVLFKEHLWPTKNTYFEEHLGTADLETVVSQCKVEEPASESNSELIHGCYNNEPKYSTVEIKKIKEKDINIPEKRDDRNDIFWLDNRAMVHS